MARIDNLDNYSYSHNTMTLTPYIMAKNLSREDIRGLLPGHEEKIVLVSDSAQNKKIVMVTRIVGCFDELLVNTSFWLIKNERIYTYSTLTEAMNNWE